MKNNASEKRYKFFPEEVKTQRDEADERIILGDNRGGWDVMLSNRFQSFGV
jgi:hypothetical protein